VGCPGPFTTFLAEMRTVCVSGEGLFAARLLVIELPSCTGWPGGHGSCYGRGRIIRLLCHSFGRLDANRVDKSMPLGPEQAVKQDRQLHYR